MIASRGKPSGRISTGKRTILHRGRQSKDSYGATTGRGCSAWFAVLFRLGTLVEEKEAE